MAINAKIILDSIDSYGARLTTLELTYPRFIHAEFMTHRVFSRNASSSRAIPVKKLTQAALDDPAFFVHIGSNKPGMQAGKEVDAETKMFFKEEWRELARICSEYALRWADEYNIHKQVVNRVMEPWHHIKVLVTATEWDNFFELRNHPDAQPEIRVLAEEIRFEMDNSEPTLIQDGEWHIPFILDPEWDTLCLEDLLKVSTARCARVSYMNHDGSNPDIEKDIALHDTLVGSKPIHASPTEHQAMAQSSTESSSNFKRWVQYRKFLEKEIING